MAAIGARSAARRAERAGSHALAAAGRALAAAAAARLPLAMVLAHEVVQVPDLESRRAPAPTDTRALSSATARKTRRSSATSASPRDESRRKADAARSTVRAGRDISASC